MSSSMNFSVSDRYVMSHTPNNRRQGSHHALHVRAHDTCYAPNLDVPPQLVRAGPPLRRAFLSAPNATSRPILLRYLKQSATVFEGRLNGEIVEAQRGEQADDGLGVLAGHLGQRCMLRDRPVRQPIVPSPEPCQGDPRQSLGRQIARADQPPRVRARSRMVHAGFPYRDDVPICRYRPTSTYIEKHSFTPNNNLKVV